ncbi:nuclear transport factor 2 family protein [Bordetella petrii]|uniref:SnoaL-like domain-containing protein n=1 Tax=Bordetella petrii (strain ATCC BAA-461 / DSM 12804 / CCUG 43448 / CIP 107267 / Se-1111R) TaxID=340100 RepID=A9IBH0_BORPD|nr:nuclear transport factor 2 family protein [Bordetella petrii]CAP41434.1 conserved hypothetical protein [Bordetella petrii]
MTHESLFSPARVADRLEIQDCMYRWCRAVDRLDLDAIRDVFHPDATDDHGPYTGDIEGLIEWIGVRHQPIPFSVHIVSNMLIEFADTDIAVVESYVQTVQHYPVEAKSSLADLAAGSEGEAGKPSQLFSFARYVDRFERRNGAWKIIRRTLVQGQKLIMSPEIATPPSNWPQSRRDRNDFVYQARFEAGLK